MRFPANPEIPCHVCGVEERFREAQESDEWGLEHTEKDNGEWVAYCPDHSDNSPKSDGGSR